MHDTLRGPVYDLVDTADPVVRHIARLAIGHPVVTRTGVVIGKHFTGKREYHWDSRTGTYSESLPLVSYDEWLIMRALCPPKEVRRRSKKEIRQPS